MLKATSAIGSAGLKVVAQQPAALTAPPVQEVALELDPQRLARALEHHRAELEAIPAERLLRISVDVAAPAMLILKRWLTWAPLMSRIQSLPAVDIVSIAKLEGYAEAVLKANAEYLTSVSTPSELVATLKEAEVLRSTLRRDSNTLIRRGLLPAGALSEVKGLAGYRNVAVDLTALVNALEKHAATIQGRSAITRGELDRASLLAQYIFRNSVERDARQPHQLAAAQLRRQAFTALSRSYDEFRRCISFLFPNAEDAERLAPSFYLGRGGRRSAAKKTADSDAVELGTQATAHNSNAVDDMATTPAL